MLATGIQNSFTGGPTLDELSLQVAAFLVLARHGLGEGDWIRIGTASGLGNDHPQHQTVLDAVLIHSFMAPKRGGSKKAPSYSHVGKSPCPSHQPISRCLLIASCHGAVRRGRGQLVHYRKDSCARTPSGQDAFEVLKDVLGQRNWHRCEHVSCFA